MWLHQILALLFFAAAAVVPLGLGKAFPGLWSLSGLHLSVVMADIAGLVLRGALYTALIAGGVLACPRLVGMTRQDLRELYRRLRNRKAT